MVTGKEDQTRLESGSIRMTQIDTKPTLPTHMQDFQQAGVWEDKTLADWARQRAREMPDEIVFPNDPARPTYAGMLADAEALTRSLMQMGVTNGDVVSFQTPNWIEAAVINLAAALGGFVINPIVTIYRDAEVLHMLADCRAKVFFVAETFRNFDYAAMVERIRPNLPDLQHVVYVRCRERAPCFDDLVENGRQLTDVLPNVDPNSIKLLLYTSGTTGHPKAVLHSHNSLARVLKVSAEHSNIAAPEITLMPSPVTHISGYSGGLEKPFMLDARTILMESWNAQDAIDLIERYNIVSTVAATPFLKELSELATQTGKTLPSFRRFACGGAAVPEELVKAANSSFANPCAYRVYGSSEVPLVTQGFLPESDPHGAAVTDGQVIDYEVRIVDDEMNRLPEGTEGEILARGPAMFMGYADPEQTREAITEDGYFKTGDLGVLLPGRGLQITGRKKDLIIRGGENISAKEIEDALLSCSALADCAVVSMPHERLGEGICAFVVAREGQPLTAEILLQHIAQSGLAKQKYPEHFEFVDALPRTASGKVRKDVLRLDILGVLSANKSPQRGGQ
jgi:acyl-CoA synthetase (AMP-forming)/AMP-acid ligase II